MNYKAFRCVLRIAWQYITLNNYTSLFLYLFFIVYFQSTSNWKTFLFSMNPKVPWISTIQTSTPKILCKFSNKMLIIAIYKNLFWLFFFFSEISFQIYQNNFYLNSLSFLWWVYTQIESFSLWILHYIEYFEFELLRIG